jgi:hypothetical protein
MSKVFFLSRKKLLYVELIFRTYYIPDRKKYISKKKKNLQYEETERNLFHQEAKRKVCNFANGKVGQLTSLSFISKNSYEILHQPKQFGTLDFTPVWHVVYVN